MAPDEDPPSGDDDATPGNATAEDDATGDGRDAREGEASGPPSTEGPRPGQMSELLRRLARSAEGESGAGWHARLYPGAVIEHFELVRELGHGGFGVVWEALDRRLRRRVAFKAVRAGERSDLGQERALMEAEAVAQLSHPNIVTIFEADQTAFGPYLILELLKGRTLAERLEQGTVPPGDALHVMVEVGRGIAHAHGMGVYHRDLKPANVFLCDDGRLKVLDLGLAHAFGHTRPAGGTPGFMAPEQARGAPEDERTDVFALGVIAFRMLSGQMPFRDEHELQTRPPPELRVPDMPELGDLVVWCLQSDPVKRPRHAGEVLAALDDIRRRHPGVHGGARWSTELRGLPPSTPRPVRVVRRWWVRALAMLATGVVLGVILAAIIIYWPVPQPPKERIVLAVADITNETGNPGLGELTRLFRTLVEQSQWLNVLPRGRLLDAVALQDSVPDRLDEKSAVEAARRTKADFVVLFRVARFGASLMMQVQGLQPRSGAEAFAFVEKASDLDHVPSMLERVAEQIRLELGEPRAAIRTNRFPAARITPIRDAASSYERGVNCYEQASFVGGFAPCIEHLVRALELDGDYALASLDLSILLYRNGASLADQRAALGVALDHPERIPPSARTRLMAWSAFLDGKESEAKKLLAAAAQATPDDKYAWWLAAEIPFHRDEFGEAIPLLRKVHALDPTWLSPAGHLADALGAIGDHQGIRELALELEGFPNHPRAELGLCNAQRWFDPAAAVQTCERAHARGTPSSAEFLAFALFANGSRERLRRHLREMGSSRFAWYMALWLDVQEGRWTQVENALAAGTSANEKNVMFWVDRAQMMTARGDRRRAIEYSRKAVSMSSTPGAILAAHLAYLGELQQAEEIARHLAPDSPKGRTFRALVRWKTGDLPGAIEELREIARGAPFSFDPPVPAPLYLLGEALAEAGRDAEAVESLRRFLAMPSTTPSWLEPKARFLLARCLERLGKREEARSELEALMVLWREASVDQPLLEDARQMVERLTIAK